MDFGDLLAKEIERKRKIETAKNDVKKHKPEVPEPEVPTENSDVKESLSPDPLLSISDAKLQESLQSLDAKYDKVLPKEEQLRTLEILVKNDRKDKQYEAFINEESQVSDTIEPEDVGKVTQAETYRKLCLQVRKFVKFSLKTWEHNIDDQFPQSLLVETKRDLVKLLYKLRSGKIHQNMLISLVTIVHDIQIEQFSKASEDYMKLSIGNVAWPIGVRDVGIHARSADSKITGDNKETVANIMQNEHTRRWIIAVKRLINWWEHRWKVGQALVHVTST